MVTDGGGIRISGSAFYLVNCVCNFSDWTVWPETGRAIQ